MRRLNVLIGITKLELGGAQQGTLYLAQHLDKRKFRVVLVSSPGEMTNEAIQIRDAKVILLDSMQREISIFKDIKALQELRKIIKDEKIDIIHTNSSKMGILGRWAGWLAKTPVIIHTIHGWPFHDFMKAKKKSVYVWVERQTARITSRLVAVAHANVKKGLNEDIGKPDKYQVIRCGIELRKFQDAIGNRIKLLAELNIPKDASIVGMIGCFKQQKDPIEFVKVAGQIGRAHV